MDTPLRCPSCQALVVDRRSPVCTTCRVALPKDWVMTPKQVQRTNAIDQDSRAVHAEEMEKLKSPWTDPSPSV